MWCYRSHVALCLLLCSTAALAQFGDYRQSPSSGLFIQVCYLLYCISYSSLRNLRKCVWLYVVLCIQTPSPSCGEMNKHQNLSCRRTNREPTFKNDFHGDVSYVNWMDIWYVMPAETVKVHQASLSMLEFWSATPNFRIRACPSRRAASAFRLRPAHGAWRR